MNLHSKANNYRTDADKTASEQTRSDDYLDGLGDCFELVMDALAILGFSIIQVNDLLARIEETHPVIPALEIAEATVGTVHDLLHEAYFEKLDRIRALQQKADFENQQNQ